MKPQRTFKRLTSVLCFVKAVFVLIAGSHAMGQSFSPYADFESMTLDQLASLRVKLTYVGVQEAATPSLVFTPDLESFDMDEFLPFQRQQINYINDTVDVRAFAASAEELDAMIEKVGTLPNVTAGGLAEDVYLSFAMVNSQPSTKGFEAVLNKADSAALFEKLRQCFAANKEGLRRLAELACAIDLLEAGRPSDVSSDVSVVLRGVRLDRSSGHYVGTAEITNNTATPLTSPVSLVVNLEGNVRLVNEDGTTCGTSPVGREFINLPGPVGAGETVALKLEFDNPDREAVRMTTKVLSGPGAR